MSFAIEDQRVWPLLLGADMTARRRNLDDGMEVFRALVIEIDGDGSIAFNCVFDAVFECYFSMHLDQIC